MRRPEQPPAVISRAAGGFPRGRLYAPGRMDACASWSPPCRWRCSRAPACCRRGRRAAVRGLAACS